MNNYRTANSFWYAVHPEIHFMKQILTLSDQLSPLLQAARKSAKLTQSDLAKRLDLSQSRMSAIELDPAGMRLDQLLAICSTLQLELVLQTKEGPMPSQTSTSSLEW
jgi:HTH-type transcriptional regulator/antitoxin HipB